MAAVSSKRRLKQERERKKVSRAPELHATAGKKRAGASEKLKKFAEIRELRQRKRNENSGTNLLLASEETRENKIHTVTFAREGLGARRDGRVRSCVLSTGSTKMDHPRESKIGNAIRKREMIG